MKRFTLLACSALLFASSVCAQKYPWADLPVTKKVETVMGEERKVYLKVDTLIHEKREVRPEETFYYETKTWYSSPTDKIGFGYVTADGKPFGIWRYYTLSEGKYELFCEGSLQNLEADNLILDEELIKKYTSLDKEALKKSFAGDLKQKAYFTGEWRFYKNGKLDRINTFSNKVKLPLQEVVIMSETTAAIASTQLTMVSPEKIHLAGESISTIIFSSEGMVTRVYANGVNLTFTKEGKPLIEPLDELPLIE